MGLGPPTRLILKFCGELRTSTPHILVWLLDNNTRTTARSYTITVAEAFGPATATYTITEAGSGDSEVYRQIYALYEQILGRDPDPAGLAFWTGAGSGGLGQMADSFLTSPEAFNTDFAVIAAYQAATGGPPGFTQFTQIVSRIQSGSQTIGDLFAALLGPGYSATTLYQYLLNRSPTSWEINLANNAGLANWFQTLIGYPGNVTPMSTPNNEFQNTGTYSTAVDHTNGLYFACCIFCNSWARSGSGRVSVLARGGEQRRPSHFVSGAGGLPDALPDPRAGNTESGVPREYGVPGLVCKLAGSRSVFTTETQRRGGSAEENKRRLSVLRASSALSVSPR